MERKLFLFGIGQISRYYTENLSRLSVEIWGYVDNNSEKWGTYFFNRKVYKPDILKEVTEAEILIACSDIKGVTEQLTQMGVQDQIVSINHVIKNLMGKMKKEEQPIEDTNSKTIIIDNLNGTWGGAEDWVHKVALSLANRGYHITVIENDERKIEKGLEQIVKQMDRVHKGFSEVYVDLTQWMRKRKPFVFFNIWTSEVMWAACAVKRLYPDDVRIISVLLNDSPDLYERQCDWDDYIDLYLCISSRVRDNLVRLYGVNKKKAFFREPFIEKTQEIKKEYPINCESPLKICYPCRLIQKQKRADLLPKLIGNLENADVNYKLDIVGDGPYEKELLEYVEKNNLSCKVRFHGRLSREDLKAFLDEEDIYLNISDFEGTSLTMLEAMASGCVPVVTDVSGVSDFITHMENGLVSGIGNIRAVADHIIYLDNNREKIKEFSMRSSKIVFDKCSFSGYMNYIEKFIDHDNDLLYGRRRR